VVARGNARQALTAQQRVHNVMTQELFAPLRLSLGDALAASAGAADAPPAEREAAALQALRARVRVVEGDLEREALGLCPDDARAVLADVTVVLHCAARIALEENIQSTLRANYYGTRELLRLAGGMAALKAFVHVSTAYVNINRAPFPATVGERVYRLDMPWLEQEQQRRAQQGQRQQEQHEQEQARGGGLRARAEADGGGGPPAEARTTRARAAAHAKAPRPLQVLRPTASADAIAGMAAPAAPDSPGACSSSSSTSAAAGPAASFASGGASAARRLASLLWSNGAVGRGAAAARAADAAAAAAEENGDGEASRAEWEREEQQRQQATLAAAAASDADASADADDADDADAPPQDPAALLRDTQHSDLAARLMACADPAEAQELVLSWTKRLGFPSTYCFGKHLAERMVVGWPGFPASPGARLAVVRPSLIHACSGADPSGPPAGFVSNFGGPAGFTLSYALGFFQAPAGVAYHGGCVLDAIPVDVVTSMVLAAAAAASAEGRLAAAAAASAPTARGGGGAGRQQQQCAAAAAAPAAPMPRPHIYHAASSTSHPLTAAALFRTLARFYRAHPPPVRLPFTSYPVLRDDHRPHMPTVGLWRGVARLKLRALCWAMRWAGREREAKGLERGFRGWEVHNSGKYDRSLAFSTDGARALAGRLAPEERCHFTLLWHPSVMPWESFFASYMAHSYRTVWKRDHRTGKKVAAAAGGGGAAAAVAAVAPAPATAPVGPGPVPATPLPSAVAVAARAQVSAAASKAGGAKSDWRKAACGAGAAPVAVVPSAGPVTRSRAVAAM